MQLKSLGFVLLVFISTQVFAESPRVPAHCFSAARVEETIAVLTQDAFKGRELGTLELDMVADYLADEFNQMGLYTPIFENAYLQEWIQELPLPKGNTRLRNVVGGIVGKNPALPGLVIGAHYDHLGFGWPEAHQENRGKIHPGADDNASGVAALLEIAHYWSFQVAAGFRPERTIVFAVFTGEEAGLVGSKYFVSQGAPGLLLPDKIFGVLNLDSVGRLWQEQSVTVFGTGSALEWSVLLDEASKSGNIPLQLVSTDVGSSDQLSFAIKNIPGIQFFGSAHEDYHRPSDTADKLNIQGILKITHLAALVSARLSQQEALLTPVQVPLPPQPPTPGRKVYFGTMPDFAFPGVGVRVASVMKDSPAEKAGLQEGDVLVRMNQTEIADLKGYSAFLKTLKAGDQVLIHFIRNEKEAETTATVIER